MILIIVFFIIICLFIYSKAEDRKTQKRLEIERKILDDVLENYNFEKEKKEISSILNYFHKKYENCHSCNGILVIRKSNNKFFLGCNNYPKCKFTKNYK